MLANPKITQVKELVGNLSRDEIIWLNGYLTGLLQKDGDVMPLPKEAVPTSLPVKITLAFGTETGNAQKLATTLAAKAKKSGVQIKLVGLDQYKFENLAKEEWFFVVISTQGEGEPPIGAKNFYDFLFTDALAFPKMNFAVLGLGDSSYPLFCKTGEDVDAQLKKAGGKQLLPLQKCDVDYEDVAAEWFDKVLATIKNSSAVKGVVTTVASPTPAPSSLQKPKGKKWYEGKIFTNTSLNGRGSSKQTFHIEIAVNEPVEYEPGDSLAIVPLNRKMVVEEILKLTGVDRNFIVTTDKHTGTVEELLTSHLNICYLLTSTIKSYAAIINQQIPDTRMDLKDLLRIYPVVNSAQAIEIIKLLKPIAPRLYSISSAPLVHEGEIHLTVGRHCFLLEDSQHFGLCSEFMGELNLGTTIKFYIHKNRAFKLPATDKDMIMIGPGIGIAPYRSFVAQRDAQGASGKSWLFFGERNFTTDFLYQTEWQTHLAMGSLTKMNVAFCGDGNEKIYVEHKMLQHAKELFTWIEAGAHIYLCGEKGPLHAAVEKALLQIIEEGKGCNAEEAAGFFAELKKSGRYEREVF